jgi:hypothetical protein
MSAVQLSAEQKQSLLGRTFTTLVPVTETEWATFSYEIIRVLVAGGEGMVLEYVEDIFHHSSVDLTIFFLRHFAFNLVISGCP